MDGMGWNEMIQSLFVNMNSGLSTSERVHRWEEVRLVKSRGEISGERWLPQRLLMVVVMMNRESGGICVLK